MGFRIHGSNQGLEVATIPETLERNSQGELFIVKVDIECFEWNLFSSNTEWIDDIFVIAVEPHDWMFPDKGTSQLLQQAMSSRGRDLIVLGENLIWIKR